MMRTRLHPGDGLGVDHAVGLRGQGQVQGDVVGGVVELVQRAHHGDPGVVGGGSRDVGIVRDQLHLEAGGAARDFHPDAPQPDDAQRLAAQLAAHQRFLLPLAAAGEGVGPGQVASQCQHHPQCVLGHRHGIGAGRVHDRDALLGGGFQVDVVDAYAGPPDDPQLLGVFQQLGVGMHRRADDEGVRILQLARQLAVQLLMGKHGPARLLLQQVHGGGRDLLGDQDLHGKRRL